MAFTLVGIVFAVWSLQDKVPKLLGVSAEIQLR